MNSSNYQLKNVEESKTKPTLCAWQSLMIEDLQRQLIIERIRNKELVKKIRLMKNIL